MNWITDWNNDGVGGGLLAHEPTFIQPASSWKVDEEKIQFERGFLCRNLKVAGGHEIIMMMAVGLLFCGFLKTVVGVSFSGFSYFKYVGQSVNSLRFP